MSIEQKIRFIQQKTWWTQSRLAEELGTTQPTVNRWLKGAEPEGPRRDAINDLYDEIYGATNILEHFVPLKGKVGAGQEIYAVEDDDPTQTAEAPANAKPNTVAVMFLVDDYARTHIITSIASPRWRFLCHLPLPKPQTPPAMPVRTG